ncbi:hypothetical protein GE061_015555 [Apolygus lucorum]|uniref:DDE Tnp4 domain-containing protein n=1 Tax=Apolygus lucorum TaxID=248454 RepID=A0A8S9XQE3_APOLU|nr:hypothetical protein GE061_015555 [Apolygus lucorum]
MTSKTASMFLWHECIAKRGSKEIGSCILKYITLTFNKLSQGEERKLIVWSDRCVENEYLGSGDLYAVLLLIGLQYVRRRRLSIGRPRRYWVCPSNSRQPEQGTWENLVKEFIEQEPEKFLNYHRICKSQFDCLLEMLKPTIQRSQVVRDPIPAGLKLSLTLRYLASGDSMVSLAYSYRVGKSTTSLLIKETCLAILDVLQPQVLNTTTRTEWRMLMSDCRCDLIHRKKLCWFDTVQTMTTSDGHVDIPRDVDDDCVECLLPIPNVVQPVATDEDLFEPVNVPTDDMSVLREPSSAVNELNHSPRKRRRSSLPQKKTWSRNEARMKRMRGEHVEICAPKRHYSTVKKRQSSYSYFLKIGGQEKVPVCQDMFLKTFGLKRSEVSIRPGKGKGAPTVTDIRALLYNPNGRIFYKLSFGDEFKELPLRKKAVNFDYQQFLQLFSNRLPIPRDKWNDLQALKQFLPSDTHSFYDQLPHEEESQRQTKRCHKTEVTKEKKKA